jgi:nicotinic acid phosphoribosyltransferase
MWDLKIRLAYAVSASLALPANADQPPIPIKGNVTHVGLLRNIILNILDKQFPYSYIHHTPM